MRLLPLMAVAICMFLQNSTPQKNAKSAHSQTPSQDTHYATQHGAQIIYVQTSRPPSEEKKTSEAPTSDQRPQRFWQRPSFTDWMLAVTTLAYLVVTWRMLRAIKRQADNAVHIERAWIDIDLQGENATYALNVTNHGRTIAKIKTWEIYPLAVPYQGTLGDRPEWPKKMLRRNELNRLVTPTAKTFLDFIPVADFFAEDWQMINSMNPPKKAYFFVAVTYEDTAGQSHTTKACYMYSLSHKFVDMPNMKNWT